jgi:glycosyltransferase involved in cell wall biosynthesis
VPTQAISNGIDLVANKPLATDKARLKRKLGLKSKYVVIYVGRLGVEKRIDVIITAMSQIYQQYDVDLLLVGDGNARKKLERQVRKLKMQGNVVFAGFVPDTEHKRQYLAASDIFAIASPVELQSIVTLEAMAAGLPVLAVDEGALPELAQQGVNGGVFGDGDSAGLARMIGHLLQDPILLKEYGEGSRKIIAHHDIDDTWKQYSSMYHKLLDK